MTELGLSVIVLTKNEEKLIERCLSSVCWADEVVVLDSGSSDRTKELAARFGASVYDQSWLGWTPQRQRGIQLARNDCLPGSRVQHSICGLPVARSSRSSSRRQHRVRSRSRSARHPIRIAKIGKGATKVGLYRNCAGVPCRRTAPARFHRASSRSRK